MNFDELCKKRLELMAEIKRLEAENEEVRLQLMACDGEESEHYSVRVVESKSDRLESLKAIKDKSRSLFNALHECGAVKEVVSTRLIVKTKS